MSEPTPTERDTRCPTCGADFLWEQMVERIVAQEREAILQRLSESELWGTHEIQMFVAWVEARGREGA